MMDVKDTCEKQNKTTTNTDNKGRSAVDPESKGKKRYLESNKSHQSISYYDKPKFQHLKATFLFTLTE